MLRGEQDAVNARPDLNCDGLCGGYLKRFRATYGNAGAPSNVDLKRVGDTLAGSYPTRDYARGGSVWSNIRSALEARVRAETSQNALSYNMFWSPWANLHVKMTKMEWLYGMVRAKADWDYKYQLGCPELESVGNFNFGLVGSVLGLSKQELLDFAGAGQMVTGTWRKEFNLPGQRFPWGDDFKDAIEVEAGIRFYELRRKSIDIELESVRERSPGLTPGDNL